jgi:hypothetical protein
MNASAPTRLPGWARVNLPTGPRRDGALRRDSLRSMVVGASSMRLRGRPSLGTGLLAIVALVALCTGLLYPLKHLTAVGSLGVVYLMGVVVVSALWGVSLGVATSVLSAAAIQLLPSAAGRPVHHRRQSELDRARCLLRRGGGRELRQ